MSTRKRATLLPELLSARRQRSAACAFGEAAADAWRLKIAAVRRKRRPPSSAAAGPRPAAAAALAAESPFHRKGTASAADFRPAYWRYY